MSYSLSPAPHRVTCAGPRLDNWSYERRETDSEVLSALLTELTAPAQAGPAWAGLSVIMPHKRMLSARLDATGSLAEVAGVANTVVTQRSGAGGALLTGSNADVTDIVGALWEAARIQAPDRPDGCLRIEQAVVFGPGTTVCSTPVALGEPRADRITVAARQHAGPGRVPSVAYRMGLDIETLARKPSDSVSNTETVRRLTVADVVTSTLPAYAVNPLAHPLRQALDQAEGTRPETVMLDVTYAPRPTAVASAWTHAGGALALDWFMLLHQAVPQVQLVTGQQSGIDLVRTALLAAIAPTASTLTTTHRPTQYRCSRSGGASGDIGV